MGQLSLVICQTRTLYYQVIRHYIIVWIRPGTTNTKHFIWSLVGSPAHVFTKDGSKYYVNDVEISIAIDP